MRLWIAPLVRSRRPVPNAGSHLSVGYDLTCFMRCFGFEKKRNVKDCMNEAVHSTISQISSDLICL